MMQHRSSHFPESSRFRSRNSSMMMSPHFSLTSSYPQSSFPSPSSCPPCHCQTIISNAGECGEGVFGFITCPFVFNGEPPGCQSGVIEIAASADFIGNQVIWSTYIVERVCSGGCGGPGLRLTENELPRRKISEPKNKDKNKLLLAPTKKITDPPPPKLMPLKGSPTIPSGTKTRGVFGLPPGTTKTVALFHNSGQLFLGAGSQFHITQDFENFSTGTLNIFINKIFGSAPQAGQLVLEVGTLFVRLGGTLQILPTTNIPIGSSFTIVKNLAHVWTGGFTIENVRFIGMPEGATFFVNGMEFQITYFGGTGLDVVITKIGGTL